MLPDDAELPSLPLAADDIPEHPAQIGPYRILALLGEGGMGRVYRAEERHPPREVALKLVRGMDRAALARFRREAEMLAALEHPGIARLYASGEADFGGVRLPWLALEYVRGSDLLSHAEAAQLDLRQRLQLLIAVCRAVHYAHGRGIIHRDLKPGNILVDQQGQVRVLDFGIARLRDEGEGMTQAGQVLGTLPYMSPEQLSGRSREVDVRSDVYSLGVIAYELVARRLPYPKLSTSTLLEALEIVAREAPPHLASIAPQARGDLDRVVMKALASEPARRYASAAEFAADLERVLDHRPVEARAPTVGYLAARFVRRHRALSAALAAVALILIAASLISLRYAWREAEARAVAEQRAAELQAVNGFIEDMLGAANPAQAQGRELSVKELLAPAEQALEQSQDLPIVRATLYSMLADTRAALGEYAHALELNQRAMQLLGEGERFAELRAALLRQRMVALTETGRLEDAEALVEAATAATATQPLEARLGLRLSIARLRQERALNDAIEDEYRAILSEIDATPQPWSEPLQRTRDTALSNLAALLRESGQLDEAIALSRQLFEQRRQRLGERAPLTQISRQKYALALAAKGEHAAAEAELRPALAVQRAVLGDRHADTLHTLQTLANELLAQGELDEAEALTREALAGWESQFGERHPQTVAALNALAYVLEERDQVDAAEAIYRRVLAASGDQPSADSLAPRNNLGMLLLAHGRAADALPEFERLLADAEAIVGAAHPMHAIFSSNLGQCLIALGQRERAITVLESAHQRLLDSLGAEHARTLTAGERLQQARELPGRP